MMDISKHCFLLLMGLRVFVISFPKKSRNLPVHLVFWYKGHFKINKEHFKIPALLFNQINGKD